MGIADHLVLLEHYKYIILIPFAIAEGPFVSLIVGFFVHLGYLKLLPSFFILIVRDIILDTVYYCIGRFFGKKRRIESYGSRSDMVSGNFTLTQKLWRDHPGKIMFLAKLAYGLSIPFLISAGLAKMSYKTFILYSFFIAIFQYSGLIAIGYYFGYSYRIVETYIRYAGIAIAILLGFFIVGYVGISKYSRKQIKKIEEKESNS